MNDQNAAFYRRIDLIRFQEFARLIGLDKGADIDCFYERIKNAKILLELGAGYGRVINGLLKKGFQGKIIALERSPELLAYLKMHIPNIVLLKEQDLKKFQINEKPEVVLWMWSGILEYSPLEQIETMQHIASQMQENGILIVEIPKQVRYVGQQMGNQIIEVNMEWGNLQAYLPTEKEMSNFCSLAGFSDLEILNYQTATHLERTLFIYKK